LQSYKAYFHSKYNKNSLKKPDRKFRLRKLLPASKSSTAGSQQVKEPGKVILFSIPVIMLFLSMILYLNPIFEKPIYQKDILQISRLEKNPSKIEQEIQNSEIEGNFINLNEIGDLVDENEQELDTAVLNPYKNHSASQRPEVLAREYNTYKINKGDSIWTISRKYKLNLDSIISLNKITSVHKLSAGNTLKIPKLNGLYYHVKKYDSLEKISRKYKIPIEEIKRFNKVHSFLGSGEVIFLNQVKYPHSERNLLFGNFFSLPLKGAISSRYGIRMHPILHKRLFHTGVDISAEKGTPVKAANSGTVIFCQKKGSYGNLVKIKHRFGYKTYYAHLNKIKVKKGQRIKKG